MQRKPASVASWLRDTRFARTVRDFRAEHTALWQFILFNLLSLSATVTDLGTYTLLNYWLLTPWKEVAVRWWLLNYSVSAGGLASLVSTASAYLLAQIVNFFVQRKATFHADGSVGASMALYLAMITAIWFFQLWFSGILLGWLVPLAGELWGGLLMRAVNGLIATLIQFPMNKYVIMRQEKPRADNLR